MSNVTLKRSLTGSHITSLLQEIIIHTTLPLVFGMCVSLYLSSIERDLGLLLKHMSLTVKPASRLHNSLNTSASLGLVSRKNKRNLSKARFTIYVTPPIA